MTTTRQEPTDSDLGVVNYREAGCWKVAPPCPQCISGFTFREADQAIIESALALLDMMERWELAWEWKNVGDFACGEWSRLRRLAMVAERAYEAKGIYAMTVGELSAIRGALMITLAVGVDVGVDAQEVLELLRCVDRYDSHLYFDHRDNGSCQIPSQVLDRLHEREYWGIVDLERAVKRSPRLRGQTLAQFQEWAVEEINDLLGDLLIKSRHVVGDSSVSAKVGDLGSEPVDTDGLPGFTARADGNTMQSFFAPVLE